MEKLIPHIEKLLIANDYVVIPNVGGFVTYYQSAQITPRGITPPLYNIGFNSDMCNNDGLLALELLRTEKISYREANLLIEQEVEKFKANLKSSNQIIIGKLGTLQYSGDKALIFKSANETGFLPLNFGLKKVYLPERKKSEEKITISIPKKNIFRYASAALILLSILIISPNLGDTSPIEYAGLNFKPKPTKEIFIEETTIVVEEQTEEILIENTVALPSIKDYHIVVACFPTITQAESYRDMLAKKQYGEAHVLPSVKTHRVIIQSFFDREEAIQYLRDIRLSETIFKDAWMHQQKVEL